MQFTLAALSLFTASALAQGFGPVFPPDGDQNGPYFQNCFCTINGQYAPDIDFGACNDLSSNFPNLQFFGDQFNGGQCYDLNQRGLERNGYAAACRRAAQFSSNFRFQRFQRFGVDAICF